MTTEQIIKNLRIVQEALANDRDGVYPVYIGKGGDHDDRGYEYCLEEVKYCFLDPVLDALDPENIDRPWG